MTNYQLLSVVIPTYNSERFIEATLDSIGHQTAAPREIVVSDDHSCDDTLRIVRRWSGANAIPIRIIESRSNSGGPARPLNAGIESATGDLIAVVDHDDWLRPDNFERRVGFLSRHRELDLVVSRTDALIDHAVCGSFQQSHEAFFAAIAKTRTDNPAEFIIQNADATAALVERMGFTITSTNLFFRKSLWRDVGGFDERFASTCDYQFLQAVCRDRAIGFIDDILIRWRTSSDSLLRRSVRSGRHCDEVYRLSKRFVHRTLPAATRNALRRMICEHALGAAYWRRGEGRFLAAAAAYLDSFFSGHPTREAIAGMIKIIPHSALDLLRYGTRTKTN